MFGSSSRIKKYKSYGRTLSRENKKITSFVLKNWLISEKEKRAELCKEKWLFANFCHIWSHIPD